MGRGAILPPVSTAERPPAAPADTAPRNMVRIPIPPAHGASILIPSIGVQKPARPAAHRLMITRTIAILMEAGQNTTKRSIAERRLALPAAIRARNMQTTEIPMQMVSATTAVRPSA